MPPPSEEPKLYMNEDNVPCIKAGTYTTQVTDFDSGLFGDWSEVTLVEDTTLRTNIQASYPNFYNTIDSSYPLTSDSNIPSYSANYVPETGKYKLFSGENSFYGMRLRDNFITSAMGYGQIMKGSDTLC